MLRRYVNKVLLQHATCAATKSADWKVARTSARSQLCGKSRQASMIGPQSAMAKVCNGTSAFQCQL